MKPAPLLIALLACGKLACSDSSPSLVPLPVGTFDLVQLDAWAPLQNDDTICAPIVEEGVLEFDTGDCSPQRVAQPLDVEIREGDRLELVGSHSTLLSDAGGYGVLSVTIDGVKCFRFESRIPSPAGVITLSAESPVSAAAGALVEVEVSNHGANSWRLNTIRVVRE